MIPTCTRTSGGSADSPRNDRDVDASLSRYPSSAEGHGVGDDEESRNHFERGPTAQNQQTSGDQQRQSETFGQQVRTHSKYATDQQAHGRASDNRHELMVPVIGQSEPP